MDFAFNLSSNEFVPTIQNDQAQGTSSYYESMIFPDDSYEYYQQVAAFLDYVLTKENMSVYFPETYIQYQENKDIVVTLNSVTDLMMNHNITPDLRVITKILNESEKVILDEENAVVKLDPNYRTCIVLRDIQDQNEVLGLFGVHASNIIYLNPDLNLFYVWFNSSKATQVAFAYLNELRSNGRHISAFIKSDTYKSVSYIDPNYRGGKYKGKSDYNKKKGQDNRNNKKNNKNHQQKKLARPTHVSVGDDFPPLDNIAKGGYDREFKKYSVENIVNIISKKKACETPQSESLDCSAFLTEQNMVLEHSKKVQKSKEPIFLSNKNRQRKGGKGNKNNQNKEKKTTVEATLPVKTEMRYADAVKVVNDKPEEPIQQENTSPKTGPHPEEPIQQENASPKTGTHPEEPIQQETTSPTTNE